MASDEATGVVPAMCCPATRAAARPGSVLRWSLIGIGLVCLLTTVALIAVGDRIESPTRSGLVGVGRDLTAVVMTVGLVAGSTMLWTNRRRRRALTRYPWVTWPINYIATRRYEWVELLDEDRRPVSVLVLSTWPNDLGKLFDHRTTEIWFAGEPSKYGVVSRPGGGDLRYAHCSERRRPPRFTFRTEGPVGAIAGAEPAQTAPKYTFTREDGRLMMKSDRPAEAQVRHGAKGDARYPSPRLLRRISAFALDWVLHLGAGLGAAIAVSPEFSLRAATELDWRHTGVNPAIALGFWLAASSIDRVVFQAISHTTVGKALFGLRVIRPDNGEHPSFGRLLGVWLVDVYLIVAVPISFLGNADAPGPDKVEDYFLPAVRRHDLRQGATL